MYIILAKENTKYDEMSRNSIRTTFSLQEEQYVRLTALAEKNDVSVAWVIRKAVQQYLESTENEQLTLPIMKSKGSDHA